ncbi:MAG: EamA family transporter [Mesorhizobium sp.]|nr:DMT family transporter [Mesorhizobium sp.]RWE29048.1 MAG: EamA family transporter [Mesorhizobium sp.]
MPGSKSPSLRIGSGVITILVTVFAMALADAFIKFVSADMTLWQIYVLRSLFVVPVLALLAGRRSWPSGLRWILLRSLALTLMYLAIYGVIPFLSLPVLAASLYTGPLFIVGLSAVFLHEPISARHWLAISTGFAGVLLIVRPAASGFTPLALVPIVAAFLYALAAVLTRAKCSHVPALTLTLWLNLVLLAFGSVASLSIAYAGIGSAMHYPFLSASWATMDGPQLASDLHSCRAHGRDQCRVGEGLPVAAAAGHRDIRLCLPAVRRIMGLCLLRRDPGSLDRTWHGVDRGCRVDRPARNEPKNAIHRCGLTGASNSPASATEASKVRQPLVDSPGRPLQIDRNLLICPPWGLRISAS